MHTLNTEIPSKNEKDYRENACHLLLGAQPQTENYKMWRINVR